MTGTKYNQSRLDQEARDLLADMGVDVSIREETEVKGFPNSDDNTWHKKYRVTFSSDNGSASFPFYGSNHDWSQNRHSSAWEIINSVFLDSHFLRDNLIDSPEELAEFHGEEYVFNEDKYDEQFNELQEIREKLLGLGLSKDDLGLVSRKLQEWEDEGLAGEPPV